MSIWLREKIGFDTAENEPRPRFARKLVEPSRHCAGCRRGVRARSAESSPTGAAAGDFAFRGCVAVPWIAGLRISILRCDICIPQLGDEKLKTYNFGGLVVGSIEVGFLQLQCNYWYVCCSIIFEFYKIFTLLHPSKLQTFANISTH